MLGAVKMMISGDTGGYIRPLEIIMLLVCTCWILVSALHILLLCSSSSSVQIIGGWWVLGFVVVLAVAVLILVIQNQRNLRCYMLPLTNASTEAEDHVHGGFEHLYYKKKNNNKNVERNMVGPVRPQFVLFGSSIVQYGYYEGWVAYLAHLYARQADIVLRGYGGWNSRRALQVLDKIFPKNAREQPSLVIVYFGGNDATLPNPNGLGPHVPLQEYVENMRKIAMHLRSLSKKTRIIFLSTPPINEAQISGNSDAEGRLLKTNEACRIYSEALLELCREMNIKAIDLWSAIQQTKDWRQVSFIDGIHLTNEASKIVLKEIVKVLKEAEWEPSLYYKSMPIEFSENSPYDPVTPDGKSTINVSGVIFPSPKEWDYLN